MGPGQRISSLTKWLQNFLHILWGNTDARISYLKKDRTLPVDQHLSLQFPILGCEFDSIGQYVENNLFNLKSVSIKRW